MKVHATAAIAHVRGVVYDPAEQVGEQNLHPFQFPGARVTPAQNGVAVLRDIRERRRISTQSPVNLIAADGQSIVATRFAFD